MKQGTISYFLDFAILCEKGKIDVECDGDTYHANPEKAVEDNARDNVLTRRRWRILRYSSRKLSDPVEREVIDQIRGTAEELGGIELPNGRTRRFSPSGRPVDQLRLWP